MEECSSKALLPDRVMDDNILDEEKVEYYLSRFKRR